MSLHDDPDVDEGFGALAELLPKVNSLAWLPAEK